MISPILRDHPRACGEKQITENDEPKVEGSPPRVRGKVCSAVPGFPASGITPARAGKRKEQGKAIFGSGDHPRACGEKDDLLDACLQELGSPPRVRGKVHRGLVRDAHTGITPARAGKRADYHRECVVIRDHPRACGEKVLSANPEAVEMGSPPRVRGKDSGSPYQQYICGITPARAGKSARRRGSRSAAWDHPRACGEKHQTTTILL